MNNFKLIGKDSWELLFDTRADLESELDRREFVTSRPVFNGNELEFFSQEQGIIENLDVKSQYADDNIIWVRTPKGDYPLSEGAWLSVKGRIEIYGRGFFMLPSETISLILNDRFRTCKKVRLMIVDDKIRAIFSGDTRGYKVIKQDELLNAALIAFEEKFGKVNFKSAYVSYDITQIKLLFPEKQEKLTDIYGNDETLIPGCVIRTSDTGHCATDIMPIWTSSTGTFSFGELNENIHVVHRGKYADVDFIADEMPSIFVKMRDSIALIKKQKNYKLKYPTKTTKEVCDRVKVGKANTQFILDNLNIMINNDPNAEFTAYDITKLFMKLVKVQENEELKLKIECIAGRVLNLDIEKMEK